MKPNILILKSIRNFLLRFPLFQRIVLSSFFKLPKWFRIRIKVSGAATCVLGERHFQWLLDPADSLSYSFAHNGFVSFEPNTMLYVKALTTTVEKTKFHVLNIGANVGLWPFVISNEIPNSKVEFTLIEPNIAAYKLLKENMRMNQIDFIGYPILLSDRNGVLPFINNIQNMAYSRVTEGGEELKSCVTLDSLDLEEVHLIIYDVEGHEFQVLIGARETIGRYKPKIIVELSKQSYVGVTKLLNEYGYGKPIWLGEKEIFSSGEKNFLFLPI